jgi:NAD(P)-dependent dehydrogenase (short-subunit alcohol dehydrogenase family)
MGKLEHKTALVTGGARGIGLGIAELLVAEGARVVVTARKDTETAALASRFGKAVRLITADATLPGDPKRAVEAAVAELGHLDVLVNNAGAFVRKPLRETTDEEIEQMLAVNTKGVLLFSREAIPHLAAAKGSIVNVTSAAALYARPNLAAYGASKAALHHATKILASELGPLGIRVNSVAPGLTRSEMTQPIFDDPARMDAFIAQTALGRAGEPADIARVVVFLASADAAWVTGQTIAASGGLLL